MPSPSDLAECLQLQREEVETLEAIYTSEVVSSTLDPSASAPEVGGLPSSPSYTATVTVIMHIDLAEGSGGQPRMVRLVRPVTTRSTSLAMILVLGHSIQRSHSPLRHIWQRRSSNMALPLLHQNSSTSVNSAQ